MKTITFTCETITPMFLSGADGSTPELRPPSIKGALRFWWRAMNGNNPNMREDEAKIFGGTDEGVGRSKIIIRHPTNIIEKPSIDISYTPHHKAGYCSKSRKNNTGCQLKKDGDRCSKSFTKKGYFFNFDLQVKFDERVISQTEIEKLFNAAFLLGGFGKRARRGFGSIRIDKIEGVKVFQSKEEIEKFLIPILSNVPSQTSNYPFIKNMEIGNSFTSYKKLLEVISLSTHDNTDNNSLGFAKGSKRFASPIYTSIFKIGNNFYPIITTLNAVYSEGTLNDTSSQKNYKTQIITSV